MTQQTLKDIFSEYSNEKANIFKNKEYLTERFLPEKIQHREEQTNQLARKVAPAIRGEKISNIFLFGTVGTGKTLVTKHVMSELGKSSNKARPVYINCKMKKVSDTEYRLIAELCRLMGREVPATGLPTDHIYKIFFDLIDSKEQNVILVLDEIDNIVKKIGDDILYSLTRVNQDLSKAKLSIIGISNDISFTERLDPRVKSSLSEEEIIFPPYNATQLHDILSQRAVSAFQKEAIDTGVIAKCAALAAQEHGDARKALDLLRVAGEITERSGRAKINLDCIDKAEEKLDTDRTMSIITSQPKQSLAVLASIMKLTEKGEDIQTGDIFNEYGKICATRGLKLLTQRRVSDLIAELDMLGIINTRVVSKGRYGRTRDIKIMLSEDHTEKIRKILEENYLLDNLYRFK
jgi:cell division control protein 6